MLFWNLVNSPSHPPPPFSQGSQPLPVASTLPSSRGLLGQDLISPGMYVRGGVLKAPPTVSLPSLAKRTGFWGTSLREVGRAVPPPGGSSELTSGAALARPGRGHQR